MAGSFSGVIFSESGPGKHMQFFQGRTINFSQTFPFDITGWTALLTIKGKGSADLLEISSANGGVTNDTATRTLWFSASAFAARAVGEVGVWEIVVFTPSGDVHTVEGGPMTPKIEVATPTLAAP